MEQKRVKRYRNPSQILDKWGYLFIAPFVIVFLVFSLYPMIYSIYLSFANNNNVPFEDFVAIDNYRWLFGQPQFWRTFSNTLIIFIMNFIPQIVSALFFAVLFTNKRIRLKGKGFFQFVYFLPNILTATSVAALFYFFFSRLGKPDGVNYQGGPFFEMLTWFGMSRDFNLLNDVWATRIVIAFVQFWMWFGNSMIIYISGIKGISDEVFEAAEMDGAPPMTVFFHITLPILKPIMLYSLITSLIGGLQMFDIPYFFGSPTFNDGSGIKGTLTITTYIYNFMFGDPGKDFSIAAAASVVLFLVSLSLSILMYFLFFKEKDYSKKVMKKVRKYGATK